MAVIKVQISSKVAGFADWLAALFGTRARGLDAFLVLTPEYQAWRRTVEYCSSCKRYVPIRTRGQDWPLCRLADHEQPSRPRPCPGSGRIVKWIGDLDALGEISRKHLQRLLGCADNNGGHHASQTCH